MSEKPKLYSLEEAQEEAGKMKAQVESGKAENYKEAEKNVDFEKEMESIDWSNFHYDQLLEIPVKFHKEIALKLIESQRGYYVAENIEKFEGLDHKEIALKLIEAGEGEYVARNLQKFEGLDHKEIALKLIESGKGYSVAENLQKFEGLDKEIALKLIEFGEGVSVAKNIEKFEGLDHKEIALKLIESQRGYYVAENIEKFEGLDKEKIEIYQKKYQLTIDESIYCLYVRENGELEKNEETNEFFIIYQRLKGKHPNWKDEENILGPFEEGANIFGYQKMFEYLSRSDLSRHDGLHNFSQIISMMQASELKLQEFYSKILNQVKMDDAEYYEGTAHHHLNSLANNINFNFQKVFEEAQKYPDIKKLQELASLFQDPKEIFASWKNLKKYF
jgi:transposase-like protein